MKTINLIVTVGTLATLLRHAVAFTTPTLAPRHVRQSLVKLKASDNNNNKNDFKNEYTVAVLGDLHMDPRDMEDYETGRNQWRSILEKEENAALVSLGDLGESKAVEPDSTELFSGTTRCHEMAAEYLRSFGVPYEMVGGNHGTSIVDNQVAVSIND